MALSLALFSFMPVAAAQTPSQFQQQAYHRISSGHCSDVGLEVVRTPSECAEAAVALGLLWGGDHDRSLTPRPEGCAVGLKGHRTFFYDNPANIGAGAGTNHEDRDQVCKAGLAQVQYQMTDFAQYQQQIPTQTRQPEDAGFAGMVQGGGGVAADYYTCGAQASESECCRAQQAQNPQSQGSPLAVGQVYCAQASDTRWWNVEVEKLNCDGSYAVVVQDDAKSKWGVTQRSLMLDQSCDDFWGEALRDFDTGAPPSSAVQPPNSKVPAARAAKAAPWKTLSAAAAAGAVPLIYAIATES